MLNCIIGLLIFGAGVLAGIILVGLFSANSYTEKYEEGYYAGYTKGRVDEKIEIIRDIEDKFGMPLGKKESESELG